MSQIVPFSSPALPALVTAAGDRTSVRATQLYDRRRDEMSLDEVERIGI